MIEVLRESIRAIGKAEHFTEDIILIVHVVTAVRYRSTDTLTRKLFNINRCGYKCTRPCFDRVGCTRVGSAFVCDICVHSCC